MNPSTFCCANCEYWCQFTKKPNEGECRKYPPEVMPSYSFAVFVGDTDAGTHWPITSQVEWCGEFVNKNATKEAK